MNALPDDLALLTDLYELTMVQGYWTEGMHDTATFSLFSRTLPDRRNFLLAAGINEALALVEDLRFSTSAIEYLRSQKVFRSEFLKWLSDWKFRGDVWALPEGTPFFENEPLVEVSAPLPEAQLLESLLMNQVHLPTLLASKAARVALAAVKAELAKAGKEFSLFSRAMCRWCPTGRWPMPSAARWPAPPAK